MSELKGSLKRKHVLDPSAAAGGYEVHVQVCPKCGSEASWTNPLTGNEVCYGCGAHFVAQTWEEYAKENIQGGVSG